MDKELQQEALGLVDLIYDAACDVRLWPVFLDELAKTVGGNSALLCLTDSLCATDNKILKCAECGCSESCQCASMPDDKQALLRFLAPHVTRVLQIRHQINAAASNAKDLLQGLINCLSPAVIIVDKQSKILSMNSRAEKLVASHELVIKHGGFELLLSSETIRLQELVADTLSLKKHRMVSGFLDITLRKGKRQRILVVPLVSGATDIGLSQNAVALFICGTERLKLTCHQVSSFYGMTNSEANLVIKLVDGLSVKDSARALGITYSTARTYLKQVYAKLGIKRQSELMQRVLTCVLLHLPHNSTLNNFRKKQREIESASE